ncbi:unannotated protein [freshwater metagenome]|uniref:Unannotated protein n=1 Tax=freshwater metagenome TaxID=449393 RepID=A0A6J7JJJ3_9ZZZZ
MGNWEGIAELVRAGSVARAPGVGVYLASPAE